jgi:hypothetical protein
VTQLIVEQCVTADHLWGPTRFAKVTGNGVHYRDGNFTRPSTNRIVRYGSQLCAIFVSEYQIKAKCDASTHRKRLAP